MMIPLLQKMASLRVTIVGLMLLLILTVWGTLYQVEHGLYLAQERFYYSWIFLIGGVVPFPGAQLVMVVLFLNLGASIILVSRRRHPRWSLIITHAGLILMLGAGAVTFYFGKNGFLALEEGASSNLATSHHDWELAVLKLSTGPSRTVSAVNASALRPGRLVSIPDSRLAIRVEEYHRHCEAIRAEVMNPPENISGYTLLRPLPLRAEPGENMPGMIFTLMDDGREAGRYLVWSRDMGPTRLDDGGLGRLLSLRRKRIPLPAVIELVEHRHDSYPGTQVAKGCYNRVIVRSGDGADRPVHIGLNKPLRLQGFTFYSSSHQEIGGGRQMSTLAVVYNHGWVTPYVATGLTSLGMLFYFGGMLVVRLSGRKREEGTRS